MDLLLEVEFGVHTGGLVSLEVVVSHHRLTRCPSAGIRSSGKRGLSRFVSQGPLKWGGEG